MKFLVILYSIIIALVFTSCIPQNQESTTTQSREPSSQLQDITDVNLNQAVVSQMIYVPVYSYIYYENKEKSLKLATTLSIRNTDLSHPILINSVRYYDTQGQFIQEYLAKPGQLPPLASAAFVIDRTDISGGLGANFIVEWKGQKNINEPIVEAVMIGTDSGQGISFVSPGRVIKQNQQLNQ